MAKQSQTTNGKQYLSIGEVADMFGVSVEVLRKWETKDFPQLLKPKRTSGGTRLYDKKQQEKVAMIIRLLREEGHTLEGAKKLLSVKQSDEETRQAILTKLKGVRDELMKVVNEIELVDNGR